MAAEEDALGMVYLLRASETLARSDDPSTSPVSCREAGIGLDCGIALD